MIALVHHIDVVPADAKYWSVDPFSGIVRDGYVYGRGAIDMKGQAVVHLMAMLALKRSGAPLTRDIVLIANADEELGSTGAQTFIERHADLLRDVEYVITEGGVNSVTGTMLTYYGVGVAEKQAFWHRLTVRGMPSHGSMPTPQNPVPRLVAALHRIVRYETPLQPTPAVEKFFRDIARTQDAGERRRWLSDVSAALRERRARDWILSNVQWNAILRNTISVTGLRGSGKTNVIPAEASADLDIRLLPDQDPAAFLATLRRVVGDTAVVWTSLITTKPPLDNPIDTELYRAIEEEARERDPGAPVTTLMSPGYTDRPLYRRLGIVAYGLDPFRIDNREYQRGLHGNDERLSVENVGFGVRFLYDILRRVQ